MPAPLLAALVPIARAIAPTVIRSVATHAAANAASSNSQGRNQEFNAGKETN